VVRNRAILPRFWFWFRVPKFFSMVQVPTRKFNLLATLIFADFLTVPEYSPISTNRVVHCKNIFKNKNKNIFNNSALKKKIQK
jgi:hypothetical protein